MKGLTTQRGARSAAEVFKLSFLGATSLLCVGASLYAAPGFIGVAGAALALTMLRIGVVDWRRYIIPDGLSLLALALGIAELCFEYRSDVAAPALQALVRGATMAGLFFAFRLSYRRLRGREGMGLGDVKLAGIAGIWLDWPDLPTVVEVAALGALGFVISSRIYTGRALDPLAKLPFGAFLAPAIWICWLLARWRN
jgi:leader peptidase (prepilin peptidase)/N-methyltransferase